ncbi:hypothetical protein [Nostoc sp. DedQUE03]|uniref:hypothetical protein n=1 Tax=Nostoc sp. DedQUE03 TaxID=3075389 RepID=UPI002AD8FE30|nr:hypothetical protein [Nostoc sp. DedQUE03]MDZ8047697.1 hypothetical protein [Nostoc sp. DedQUE02]
MSLIDGIFLTLLNTVACLTLPKLLSLILSAKRQNTAPSASVTSQDPNSEIPSFS